MNPSNTLFSRLVQWCANPTTTEELDAILKEASLRNLFDFVLIESASPEVGTLAWAEIGRRKGYFDFEYLTTNTSGQLKLELRGTARSVSQPTLRARRKA